MAVQSVKLSKIKIDAGTQARAKINDETVGEYAERYEAGDTFPFLTVFFDGVEHYLADGFHRYLALNRLERKAIDCDVRKGTLRDAILFAAYANGHHGMRRTPADKRKAVSMLLADAEWAAKSNRWIADACCVGDDLVADVRNSTVGNDSSNKRTGRDGKQRTATQPATKRRVSSTKPAETPAEEVAAAETDEPAPPAELTPEQKLAELAKPYRECVNALNEVRRTMAKLAEEPATGAHLVAAWNRIKKALDDAKTPIAQATPAAWCPKCKGEGCPKCQKTGWLPKSVWDGLSEKEKA